MAARTPSATRLRGAVAAYLDTAAPGSGGPAIDRVLERMGPPTADNALAAARSVAAELVPRPLQPSGKLLRRSKPQVCLQVPQVIAARDAGRLSGQDQVRLAAHLERCAHCAATDRRFAAAAAAFDAALAAPKEDHDAGAAIVAPVSEAATQESLHDAGEPGSQPDTAPGPDWAAAPAAAAASDDRSQDTFAWLPAEVATAAAAVSAGESSEWLQTLPEVPEPADEDTWGEAGTWSAGDVASPASMLLAPAEPTEWVDDDAAVPDVIAQAAAPYSAPRAPRMRRRLNVAAPIALVAVAGSIALLASGIADKSSTDKRADSATVTTTPAFVTPTASTTAAERRARRAAAARRKAAADHRRAVAKRAARRRAAARRVVSRPVARTTAPVVAAAPVTRVSTPVRSTPVSQPKATPQRKPAASKPAPSPAVQVPVTPTGPTGSAPSSEPGRQPTP